MENPENTEGTTKNGESREFRDNQEWPIQNNKSTCKMQKRKTNLFL
jgi:hypothetical protein